MILAKKIFFNIQYRHKYSFIESVKATSMQAERSVGVLYKKLGSI